jgi:site-specific recombinase XerD
MTENTIVNFTDTATGRQKVFYVFLAEKEQRSGSHRTVEGYSRMLQDFFGRSGKQPDNYTAKDIFVYAHSPGLSGKLPSAITIWARIACISSFFRFLIRMDIVQSNHVTNCKDHKPLLQHLEVCPVTKCITSLK